MSTVTCPRCSTSLAVPPGLLGEVALCPRCRHRIHLAAPAPIPSVPVLGRRRRQSGPGEESLGPNRLFPWLLGGAVVVALFVGLALVLVLLLGGKKRPADRPGTLAGVRGSGSGEDTDGPPGTGSRYALLIGVRDYKHLPHLLYTENDVTELADLLRPASYEVTLLTGSTGADRPDLLPTGKNIRSHLDRLVQKCGKSDTLLLAFAGHGLQGGEERDCFFCPGEGDPARPDTLVSLTQVYAGLNKSRAGAKLMLVDACRNEARGAARGINGQNAPRPPRGVAALFSCSPGQQAFESPKLGKGHGVFFHFVLEGLRGEACNREGEVTWDTLGDYVKRHVSREVPRIIGGGARQTPHGLADLMGESPNLINRQAVSGEIRRFSIGPKGGTSAVVTPDDQFLVGLAQGVGIHFWRIADGQLVYTYPEDRVFCLTADPLARFVGVGHHEEKVGVSLLDVKRQIKIQAFPGHQTGDRHAAVTAIAFSPDGKRLLSVARGYSIRQFDVEKRSEISRYQCEWGKTGLVPRAVSFSPDGEHCVIGVNDNFVTTKVYVINLQQKKEVARFTGHKDQVSCIAVSTDNRRVISGSWDKTIRVWEMKTGREILVFDKHTAGVNSLAVSQDNRLIVSGGWDHVVRVWELDSGREVCRFEGHKNRIWSVGFLRNSPCAFSYGEDPEAKLWRLPPSVAWGK